MILNPLPKLIDADKFFLEECQRCGANPYIESNSNNRVSLKERLDKAPRVKSIDVKDFDMVAQQVIKHYKLHSGLWSDGRSGGKTATLIITLLREELFGGAGNERNN